MVVVVVVVCDEEEEEVEEEVGRVGDLRGAGGDLTPPLATLRVDACV